MRIVIIGNGAAGIAAAEAARKTDADCEIIILSDEKYYHYSRPRLIEFLPGKVSAEQIVIRKAEWYSQNRITLRLNETVQSIDSTGKKIITESGELEYDRLILAAGAACFLPPIQGSDERGVFTLRTIDDAEKIRAECGGKKSICVIGGGLLGLEAAIGLTYLGLSVVVVEVFDRLLPRQLDSEGAVILKTMLEHRGLSFLLPRQVESIYSVGGSLTVHFGDGSENMSDLILFSAGVRPRLELAKTAGLAVEKGVIVNSRMETSITDIYACGDVAQYNGMVYGLWMAAREQGLIAGTNAAGGGAVYPGSVPSTRLKVAGIDLASMGSIEEGTDIHSVSRKNEELGIYRKLFIRENRRLIGAILLGDLRDANSIQERIRSGVNLEDGSEKYL